jgi:response regulator of citrate/malate metabolism
MRLLIVDDEMSLAGLTADEFRWVDQSAHNIESISLAGDLETAMHLLPKHDAVLCDGQFPASPSTRSSGDEWRTVQRETEARGIVFILYSGGAATIEGARSGGIPAVFKPAKIERIYELLIETWLKVRPAVASSVPAR